MRSLTSFLPEIAPIFGITEQALYERQRALVRLNMLPVPKGRGRGSGAAATPETVAHIVVAALATDNLSEIDGRVEKLASAPFIKERSEQCRWTGARTFLEALTFLLSPEAPIGPGSKPGGHTTVHVLRNDLSASINFVWSRRPGKGTSKFGEPVRIDDRIKVEAELPYEALRSIRQRLNLGGNDELQ